MPQKIKATIIPHYEFYLNKLPDGYRYAGVVNTLYSQENGIKLNRIFGLMWRDESIDEYPISINVLL